MKRIWRWLGQRWIYESTASLLPIFGMFTFMLIGKGIQEGKTIFLPILGFTFLFFMLSAISYHTRRK